MPDSSDILETGQVLPPHREGLFVLTCGEDRVVHDDNAKRVYVLNETAALVFERCDGATSLGKVISELREEYDVCEETILRDVNRILRDFRANNLLE